MKKHIGFFAAVFIMIIVFGGCNNKTDSVDSDVDLDIPATLNECYAALDQLLDADTKADIKAKNSDELIVYHFGLGMWIRNNWIYPTDDKIAKVFLNAGINHPDNMSHEIITGYHYYLNDILYEIE